jgi:hypothetical protein
MSHHIRIGSLNDSSISQAKKELHMNRVRGLHKQATSPRRGIIASIVIAGMMLAMTPGVPAQGQGQGQGNHPQNFTVIPITITSVAVVNGQLVANGLVGTTPFQVPLLLSSHNNGGPCPILDLQPGPIDLTLLGLRVETSPICLEVTAIPGGGLLGDLLCGVANLLQGGTDLAGVLDFLQTTGNLDRFLNGLTAVLNQVFDRITSNTSLAGASCSVLSLAVGPLDLNLLGLVVELDDCANGPVTVDITAIPGGGLLGDLLCSLAGNALNNPLNTTVQRLLWQVTQLIGQLL